MERVIVIEWGQWHDTHFSPFHCVRTSYHLLPTLTLLLETVVTMQVVQDRLACWVCVGVGCPFDPAAWSCGIHHCSVDHKQTQEIPKGIQTSVWSFVEGVQKGCVFGGQVDQRCDLGLGAPRHTCDGWRLHDGSCWPQRSFQVEVHDHVQCGGLVYILHMFCYDILVRSSMCVLSETSCSRVN